MTNEERILERLESLEQKISMMHSRSESLQDLQETHAGEAVSVKTKVLLAEGKKLKLSHEMIAAQSGEVRASCDQFLLHVSLETRKSCDPLEPVKSHLASLAQ